VIKYFPAPDIEEKVREIVKKLGMNHIDTSRVRCIRSKGSASEYIIARCHSLPRALQVALNEKPHYVIEVISKNFDDLPEEEKIKTLIHELMHIPKSFKGGFLHHRGHVTKRKVEKMYKKYKAGEQKKDLWVFRR